MRCLRVISLLAAIFLWLPLQGVVHGEENEFINFFRMGYTYAETEETTKYLASTTEVYENVIEQEAFGALSYGLLYLDIGSQGFEKHTRNTFEVDQTHVSTAGRALLRMYGLFAGGFNLDETSSYRIISEPFLLVQEEYRLTGSAPGIGMAIGPWQVGGFFGTETLSYTLTAIDQDAIKEKIENRFSYYLINKETYFQEGPYLGFSLKQKNSKSTASLNDTNRVEVAQMGSARFGYGFSEGGGLLVKLKGDQRKEELDGIRTQTIMRSTGQLGIRINEHIAIMWFQSAKKAKRQYLQTFFLEQALSFEESDITTGITVEVEYSQF